MIDIKHINVEACAEMSEADFKEHMQLHHNLSSAECKKLHSECCKLTGKSPKKAAKKKKADQPEDSEN